MQNVPYRPSHVHWVPPADRVPPLPTAQVSLGKRHNFFLSVLTAGAVGLVVLFLAFSALVVIAMQTGYKSGAWVPKQAELSEKSMKRAASDLAETAVRERLAFPSSAQFYGYEGSEIVKDGAKYKVRSLVSARGTDGSTRIIQYTVWLEVIDGKLEVMNCIFE